MNVYLLWYSFFSDVAVLVGSLASDQGIRFADAEVALIIMQHHRLLPLVGSCSHTTQPPCQLLNRYKLPAPLPPTAPPPFPLGSPALCLGPTASAHLFLQPSLAGAAVLRIHGLGFGP